MAAGDGPRGPLRPRVRSRPVAPGGVPHEPSGAQRALRDRPVAVLHGAWRMALPVVGDDARRGGSRGPPAPRSRARIDHWSRRPVGPGGSLPGRLDGATPAMTRA